MASKLGVADEVDEQHTIVGVIRRRAVRQFVTPESKGLPRSQFVRGEADHIGTFIGLLAEFEILQPNFVEPL